MNKQCGAKTRSRSHEPCRLSAMLNGRCRLHGGLSTGAKTEEGMKKQKMARWKSGFYSKEAIQERRELKKIIKSIRDTLQNL